MAWVFFVACDPDVDRSVVRPTARSSVHPRTIRDRSHELLVDVATGGEAPWEITPWRTDEGPGPSASGAARTIEQRERHAQLLEALEAQVGQLSYDH